jgi:hypothetical protein
VKDKYGENSAMKMLVTGDADSSSTSETEDEDGEVICFDFLSSHIIQL